MDEFTDFEELIDLNTSFLSVSQRSLQWPISDILDKLSETVDESKFNLATGFISKKRKENKDQLNDCCDNKTSKQNVKTEISDINKDLEEFESILTNECLNSDSIQDREEIEHITVNATNEQKVKNEISNNIIIPNELEEFENILAAKCMGIDSFKCKPNEISTNNEENLKNVIDDFIDLTEFEDILINECSEKDCTEDEIKANDTCNTNHRHILDGNVFGQIDENVIDLDEFERIIATESVRVENNSNNSNADERNIIFSNCDKQRANEIDEEFSNENVDEFVKRNHDNDFTLAGTNLRISITRKFEEKYIMHIVPYEIPLEFEVDKNKLEVVSAVTTQTKENYINSDSEDGYNSSDFEFITEDEASKAGLITKFGKFSMVNNESRNNNAVNKATPSTLKMYDRPGITNSRNNEAKPSDHIKYSKYRYQRCYARSSDYHVIPEGEQFLDMFRGEYAPMVLNNLHTMRNKSILPTVPMAVNNDDLMLCPPENDEDYEKYKDDADESLKCILATYPGENRRKRRRY